MVHTPSSLTVRRTRRRPAGIAATPIETQSYPRPIGWLGIMALALAVLGLVGGCNSIPDAARQLRAPDITVVDLRLEREVGDLVTASFDLVVENPNERRLAIEGVRFEMVLNGTHLGGRTVGEDVFISGGDLETLPLALRFAPGPSIVPLLDRSPPRGVGYLVTGTLKVVAAGVPDQVPFRGEGRWP